MGKTVKSRINLPNMALMYARERIKKSSPGKEVKTWRANAKNPTENGVSPLRDCFVLLV
jgi:hypothetical protein